MTDDKFGPDDDIEVLSDGKRVVREGGRFSKVELTPEVAAKMRAHTRGQERNDSQELADALTSVIVDPDDPRADAMRLLVRELAAAAGGKGAGRGKAIETAINLLRMMPEKPTAPVIPPVMNFPDNIALRVLALLNTETGDEANALEARYHAEFGPTAHTMPGQRVDRLKVLL